MWISRARPRNQNTVYINSRNSADAVNRKAVQDDTVRYRADLRREAIGRTTAPTRVEQARPALTGSRPLVRLDTVVYRGRDIQKSQPASQTGYGGYGSRKDATAYRERGQTSRRNMQQITRPGPAQHTAVSGIFRAVFSRQPASALGFIAIFRPSPYHYR